MSFCAELSLLLLLRGRSACPRTIHGATSIRVPVNQTTDEKDDDDAAERHPRLIPYMTYYLVNNFVRAPQQQQQQQQQHQQQQQQQQTKGAMYQKPTTSSQEDRFVPSVQYDPKGLGAPDSDIFLPLRHGEKDAYEDFRTSPGPAAVIPETRYQHTTARSEYTKLAPAPAADYPSYGLGAQEFESVRFAPQQQQQQPTKTRYAVPSQAPPPPPPPGPAAGLSLQHVLTGLQLTNRLPEVLSKDNIDSSIKTLVEILNILNAGKRDNNLLLQQHPPTYGKYKATKPKVITESNYEATRYSPTPQRATKIIPIAQHEGVSTYVPGRQIASTRPYQHLRHYRPIAAYVATTPIGPVGVAEKPTEAPIRYDYLDPSKVPNKLPMIEEQEEEVAAKAYAQPTETRTPMPSTEPNTQKIVQYYVPIVQDIGDDEDGKPAVQSKEPMSMSPSVVEHHASSLDNYHHEDSILEDEEEQEEEITEPTIPPALKYGATRGKPRVDYPAYADIPETDFSCKEQRYKGFFGDPQTGCQVWHYCDLNGGKSSFLCPNGTIFNQVALTCDWWFNVKCESTTQLYVLNERLYKYILPVMPKFPEDFTGPEVDKYLELKFKEMEAKMSADKKNKTDDEQREDKDEQGPVNTLQSIEDSKKR